MARISRHGAGQRFKTAVGAGLALRAIDLRAGPVLALLASVLGPPMAASADEAEHLVAVVETKASVHQPYGQEIVAGVKAAADRINASGGVLGRRVRLATWSEDCSRDRAAQVAEEIAQMKPAAVIGHLCAVAALAAAPVYAMAGVLFIAPGVRHPELTGKETEGGLVLRLAGRDDRFAADAVGFIKSHHAGKTLAVVSDRTRQGRALAEGVVAEARRQQVVLALDLRIEAGQKSYNAVAARVQASGAGVVVAPAQPIELGVLVRSLRRQGTEVPFVGSEILAVPGLGATARALGDRLVVMMPWSGVEDGAHRGATASGGNGAREAPRRRAAAAFEVWAAAAKHARSTGASAVAAAARTIITPTEVGPLRFDDAGDALVPSYVASTWRDGDWRPLKD